MFVKRKVIHFLHKIAQKLGFSKQIKTNKNYNQSDLEFEELENSIESNKLYEIINSSTSELNNMKIGILVRSTMPEILTSEKISELEVHKLTTEDYSKMIFDMNYPVLKLVDEKKSIKENRMVGNYTRYYAFPYFYMGKQYLISSEWYDHSHESYTKWLKRKVIK